MVRRNKGKNRYTPRLRAAVNAVRFINRARRSANQMRGVIQAVNQINRNVRKRKAQEKLGGYLIKGRRLSDGRKRFRQIRGNASGTTRTTTRMIVRKTPREQRFMRKMFQANPQLTKYVERFGFSWLGANSMNQTIWYSVCHNKFNNLYKYLINRATGPPQTHDGTWYSQGSADKNLLGTNPANFIYLGKCTFNYELYNPTNYIITCYVYDLVLKHDTPFPIKYGNTGDNIDNCSPEYCMYQGTKGHEGTASTQAQRWVIGDPESHGGNAVWNTVGLKPTDVMYFNVMWKVKGIKKIILPPGTSHHHVVIFNPKKKITYGNLIYPRSNIGSRSDKYGVGGLTQATLFGFEGQVAAENNSATDTTDVGTLPGRMVVKCIRKINVFNFPLNTERIIQDSDLQTLENPVIWTDLVEAQPSGP